MSIKALLPVAPSVNLLNFGDTGSDSLDIFEQPDLQALQIPPFPAYWHRNQWIQVITAGGVVYKELIWLQVRLLDAAHQPVGPWAIMLGVINPGNMNWMRCSNMYTRQQLFTATAPDGLGNLFVGEKKHGVTSQLPTV